LANIYLGTPYFNSIQKDRVKAALIHLSHNQTANNVHFPFDYQYKGASVENQKDGLFGSLEWQLGTYHNDMTAIGKSDVGLFLYDTDNIDDGCAYEMGVFRAMQKPVVALLFTEAVEKPEINLMIAQGVTTFMDGDKELPSLDSFDFDHPLANPVCPYPVF